MDQLCALVGDVERHAGKLKGLAQFQVVQYGANVLGAEMFTRQVVSNLEGLARVDVEGRVAEGFGYRRVLEVGHGSVERKETRRRLCLKN